MKLRNKILLLYVQKKKDVRYMEMSRDNDQKNAYISDELQLQNPF